MPMGVSLQENFLLHLDKFEEVEVNDKFGHYFMFAEILENPYPHNLSKFQNGLY